MNLSKFGPFLEPRDELQFEQPGLLHLNPPMEYTLSPASDWSGHIAVAIDEDGDPMVYVSPELRALLEELTLLD